MAEEGRRGPYRKRQSKVITPIEGDAKHAPNALREILNHIRETALSGEIQTQERYAQSLNKAWNGPRYGAQRITKNIFRATEDGLLPFYYRYLEAYARELKIPSALILLLSRLHAELKIDPSGARALQILQGMRAVLDGCADEISATKAFDVRSAVERYSIAGGADFQSP